MPHPNTRHSLIVRLQDERNDQAWDDFVVAYEPFLYRMAARQGVPERDVPDVVQQVLLAVARSVEGWSDDGRDASFRRWLSTVARNVVIRFMTRERRQPQGGGGTSVIDLLKNVADEPAAAERQRYDHELIVWAAEQVRSEFLETSWTAFWATTVDGRRVADVATELNISVGSIYMSRSRIMARIRGLIQDIMD